MFEQVENSYLIIDYSIQGIDNIQSMKYFLNCIGATSDNIEIDDAATRDNSVAISNGVSW
jgi:hypothetical protein